MDNKISNEITINIEEIRTLPDNSIIDAETIRQIALYSIKTGDGSLDNKIKKGFEFAGLYPHVIKSYNIKPEFFKSDDILILNDNAKKKLEYITGAGFRRDFPISKPSLEWVGAVLDFLDEIDR